MAKLRAMLHERKGKTPVEDWANEINGVIVSIANDQNPDKSKIRIPTLYAYLNGKRNITGKGARLLAMYFHHKRDFDMVDAITKASLGIPYPMPPNPN